MTAQKAAAVATQAATGPSAAPRAGGASAVLHAVPRVTLVTHDGFTVLLLVAIPLLASLVVGLLLWLRAGAGSIAAGIAAWTLSVAVLTGAVVGFVTFLIGIAVIPNGILLVAACACITSSSNGRDTRLLNG